MAEPKTFNSPHACRWLPGVRNEVDLEQLTDVLLGAVQEMIQPTEAGLWLRPTMERTPAAGAGQIGDAQ
jgi:hypothetical protein